MKGVIFTKLVGYLETRHGVAFADDVVTQSKLPTDGAYTSVGNYPSAPALTIVGVASRFSGIDGTTMTVSYRSHRPMAHIAFGLIRQCLISYGETHTVRWHTAGRAEEAQFIISAEGE